MSALGTPRRHHRSTASTNADAREAALAGAPHGTLITASEQTHGRGRQGREWHAPAGRALLCSLVIADPPPLLALLAGLAVATVVGEESRLKWPNDVLLSDGRKVAGILIEARARERWAVVGVGINVAVDVAELPAEFRDRAGSLELPVEAIESTLAALLAALEDWLARPAAEILTAWRARDALIGREVHLADGRHVIARGVDDQGHLLAETVPSGEMISVAAGEVHLLGG